MKKILVIFYLFVISICLIATDVSGNQSGTWGLTGSPYNVIGEIVVPTGETLEIEAGVEVIAMGNYRITALGNILSTGTQNDSIRFHGNNGLNWGGIRLENDTVQSTFNFCRISNTDDTNDYGIHSINSPVLINHSFFDDHQKAISFSALSATTPSYMEIKNSKIANIQKSGITIVDNSNVLIDSCEVTQCGLGPSFYGAIQLSLQSNSSDCSPTISNSYIHHNGKQGITMGNLFNYNEMAPTVEYNDISYNYTGVYLYNGKGYYTHNYIHHNFIENNADSGAGVMLYGSGANGTFTYNKITGNYTGFYLASDATANLGDLENASTDDDGYNCIYDNIFYTGEEYSVYNSSAMDVKAENTVWDTDPPIDVTIIDGNDNPAYGIVDYEPTLSPFAPPEYLDVDLENFTINPGPPAYPTYAELVSWNLYMDDVLVEPNIIQIFWFEPIYGEEITYGASFNYIDPIGESAITDTTIYIPHILNPPQNPVVSVDEYAIFTWDPPEPGSTSPPHPLGFYNVYLDGVLEGVTNEQTWIFTGLVYGQTYLAEVCANYEAGSSELVGVEFIIPHILNPPLNVVLNPNIGIIFWEPPEDSNTTLTGYNLYLDGVLVAIVGVDVFEYQYTDLIPGQQYTAGVSALYVEGESDIIEGLWAPHICNPPTNASYEIIDDHIHLTWQEPEPGSTHPFLNYRIYLDGELFETTELSYDIYDLVSGQTYLVGLTAFYEYLFESIPIEVEITFMGADDVVTLETKLLGNYPNPFNPTTTISFSTTESTENTELVIYNIKGQKVKQLVSDQLSAGEHSVVWDGRDENGKSVSSGIYFYKLIVDSKTEAVKKCLLLK